MVVHNARAAESEGIDGVSGGGGFHIGFESVAIHHVDRAAEQGADLVLQTGIVEDGDPGSGIEFDHDVGVAVGPPIASRP